MSRLTTGTVYTYAEINRLSNDPMLRFRINGAHHPLQDAHVHPVELMAADPAWSDARFRFDGATREWIELFTFIGADAEMNALVAHEPRIDPFDRPDMGLWVTPRSHPRAQ